MNSKGQIVIPAEIRCDIKEGEKFVVIRNDSQIILKKIKDLKFAKRTDEAFERYKKGKFKKMDFDDFIAEINKW